MRQRFAFDPYARGVNVEGALEDEEDPIHRPRFHAGEGAGVDQVAEVLKEFRDALAFCRCRRESIVICRTEPHIVHQQREPDHDTAHAHRAAELEVPGIVDLGIFAFFPAINDYRSLRFLCCTLLQCTVRKATVGMAICLLVLLGSCTALPCASRCERVRINPGGVLRVRILEDGGDTGFPRSLERAGSLDVARVACFTAMIRVSAVVLATGVLRCITEAFRPPACELWAF